MSFEASKDKMVDFPTPCVPKHPITRKSCWSYKNSRTPSQSCIFSSTNFTQFVISTHIDIMDRAKIVKEMLLILKKIIWIKNFTAA